MTEPSTKLQAQIARVDPIAVAQRIVAQGQRASIAASTVDIIAMAMMLNQLCAVSDRTYELFVAANQAVDHKDDATLVPIRRDVISRINEIGSALEALGYGQSPSTAKET